MTTRKYSSDIVYPFVPDIPDRTYVSGIKDLIIRVQGDATLERSTASSILPAYVYLYSISQVTISGDPHVRYVFHAVQEKAGDVEDVYEMTFDVSKSAGLQGVSNYISEFARGYMVVDGKNAYSAGDLVFSVGDYMVEPCRTVWMISRIRSISFINEYRHYDPAQRTNLANTHLLTFSAPAGIELESGYNVSLSYGEASGTLDIDGNAGNGLGLAPDNMWDTGPAWGTGVTGVLSINGVRPDKSGNIPISGSSSISIQPARGELEIGVA